MIKTFVFALAIAALATSADTSRRTDSNSGKTVLLASGGSNCPVYYGCPAPPPTPPPGKGGSGGGGGTGGGGTGGGGIDNTQPHA